MSKISFIGSTNNHLTKIESVHEKGVYIHNNSDIL